MSQRISREEAHEFRKIVDEIFDRTVIPKSWLAELLGYSKTSGLSMALEGSVKPSRAVYEKAQHLIRGLRTSQGKADAR